MLELTLLVVVVGIIIFSTTKLNLHPFLALLFAAIAMGFLGGLSGATLAAKLTEGFGGTLKSIGVVIACGAIIGVFLERSGGAQEMAGAILKLVGEKRAPLAMNLTGFIVSVPVFCDSGFVVLASLNRALNRRTGTSMAILAVALSTGLYATHVFVPPTPGPLAAAATLGADIGLVLILGLIVALPASAAGLLWAQLYARKFSVAAEEIVAKAVPKEKAVRARKAFLPLILPIALIALKSVADYPTRPLGDGWFRAAASFIGHPVMALLAGVLLSFRLAPRQKQNRFEWVNSGLQQAGVIILITGAGGAFGNILRATGIGDSVGELMLDWRIGVLLPFLLSAGLKTAQGSSTVAIITAAALVSPLLPAMGLSDSPGRELAVLAIGAGAMTVSHLNDSYFWVVSQFSNLDAATALRCHTLATLVQGVAGILLVALLSRVLL